MRLPPRARCLPTLQPVFALVISIGSAMGQSVERVDDLNPGGRGSGPHSPVSYQGALYYQADGGSVGRELMKYDGAAVSVDGISYTRAGSSDLALFERDLIELSPAQGSALPKPSAGWSHRTFRLSGTMDAAPAGFAQLVIGIEP